MAKKKIGKRVLFCNGCPVDYYDGCIKFESNNKYDCILYENPFWAKAVYPLY